jgi:peptide/nickel transport system ATP-binding protein
MTEQVSDNEKLLDIQDLVVQFHTSDGIVQAINNLNLSLNRGETLGLVGETGAGKTTTALAVMGLIDTPPGKIVQGKIIYNGTDLLTLSEEEYRKYRGSEFSMIFQDPMTALNPVLTVIEQIAETIANHQKVSDKEAIDRAIEMLELVRIPPDRAYDYPHQFSGGMKQRVVIAIALACNPHLLIADEPTTALDVTIQAQVLEMMKELRGRLGTSMIMITHDLGVVSEICDKVAIMYAGEIIEYGTLRDIFLKPSHPYTVGLFGSIPKLDEEVEFLSQIEGLMPDPMDLPTGCKFNPRCKYREPICSEISPVMTTLDGEDHCVRCLIYENKLKATALPKGEDYHRA